MSREKVLQIRGQEFVMFLRLTFLGLSTLEKFKITLEQIFLTVGQNNYGNKIPFPLILLKTNIGEFCIFYHFF